MEGKMSNFLTLLASLLAAGGTGLLAVKSFHNLKPYVLFRQPKNTLVIRNTNKDRDVIITDIINPTTRDDIEIANINFQKNFPDKTFSHLQCMKKLAQGSKHSIHMLLEPSQEVEIEFVVSTPGVWIVLERDSFNFFDQLPMFNVVVRDKDPFKSRNFLAGLWHRFRKYNLKQLNF